MMFSRFTHIVAFISSPFLFLYYSQVCIPGCSLEGLMLKLKLQTLATSCEELTHWKRLRCWEGLGAGGEGDDRG